MPELPTPGYLDQLKKQRLLSPRGQKFVNVGYGTLFEFPPPTILDPDNARWVSESSYRSLSGNFLLMSQTCPPEARALASVILAGRAFGTRVDGKSSWLLRRAVTRAWSRRTSRSGSICPSCWTGSYK